MPTTLTPGSVPNSAATVAAALTATAPAAGDNRTAASVATPLQQLLTVLGVVAKLFNSVTMGGPTDTFAYGGLFTAHAASFGPAPSFFTGNVNCSQDVAAGGNMSCVNFTATGTCAVGGALNAASGAFVGAVGCDTLTATTGSVDHLSSNDGNVKITGRAFIGANADTTYQLVASDMVAIPATGILSADRSYTIGFVGAGDGMRCVFQNYDTTGKKITLHGIPFYDGGGGLILRNSVSGDVNRVEVTRIGGVLYATHVSSKP